MDTKIVLKIPNHVGIVLDGQKEWAEERNLPILEGYVNGLKRMKESLMWFSERKIKFITFYLFSSNDWNLPQNKINDLMKCYNDFLVNNLEYFAEKGFKIIISGEIEELPGNLSETCQDVVKKSADNIGITINLCINYNGRREILNSVKKIINKKIDSSHIHEGIIRKYLYNGGLPDIDLIVNVNGKKIVSDMLLWQSSNGRYVTLNKYWPDFEKLDVDIIINEFQK